MVRVLMRRAIIADGVYFFCRAPGQADVESFSSIPAPAAVSRFFDESAASGVVVVTHATGEPWLGLIESRAESLGVPVMRTDWMPGPEAEPAVLLCDLDAGPAPRHRRSPIVVATSFTAKEEAELIRNGACACVAKDDLLLLEAVLERELRRAEHRRQRKEERERLEADLVRWVDVARTVPGAAWEQRFEPDGTVVRVLSAQRTLTVTGYSAEEWVANPDLWKELLHPEDRERAIADISRIGAAGTGGTTRFRWVGKDGGVTWVEAHCAPVFDDEGRVAGMRGMSIDITDRQLAQERSRMLSRVVEAASDLVLLTDAAGRITWANAAFLQTTGWTCAEISGQPVAQVVAQDWVDGMLDARNEPPQRRFGMRRDGSVFDALVRFTELREEDGRLIGQVIAATAIAEIERGEATARRNERKLRVLSEAAFDGLIVHDFKHIIEINRAGAAMYGYEPEEMIGLGMDVFLHPDDREMAFSAMRSGLPRYETRGVRRDGTIIAVEIAAANFHEEDGSMMRVCAMRDVSYRRAYEQQFRALVEVAFDGVLIERDGFIEHCNQTLAGMLQYPMGELIGMRLAQVISGHVEGTSERFVESFAITRDGMPFPIEFCTVAGAEGQRVYAIRDVTVQKAAESELIRREAAHRMFRSLIENGSDVICLIDLEGVVRYTSPSTERLLGYAQGELLNNPFLSVIHEEDRVVAEMFFQQQVANPSKQSDVDLRVLHKDGSLRWFSIVTSNIMRDGRVVSVISNARDITDRRLLESQLEQANRLTSLGRLAATVAHEFNNVLMGIQPFADLMQLPNVAPEMIAKGAAHIAASVARGKRVTLDILRFTRPAQPSLSAVDLHAWWEKLSVEMQAMTDNKITYVSDFAGEELCVMADAAQLSQVFANLITNARDAMPGGGTLTIRAQRPGPGETYPFGLIIAPDRYVHLSVEDTGIGMADDVRRHVFDPLFTTKQRGGTGLGLAVAHQVVTRHNGAIFVESEVGRGSTFHIFLPLAAASKPAPAEDSGQTDVQARRVLVVEDEHSIATGIQEMLRPRGIEVVAVMHGEEAVEAARRLQPDVAIVDMRLPGIDGAEVGRRLRAEWPDLAIVFVSGDARELPLADDAGFLRKPFTLNALLQTMRRLESNGV